MFKLANNGIFHTIFVQSFEGFNKTLTNAKVFEAETHIESVSYWVGQFNDSVFFVYHAEAKWKLC